MSKMNSITVTVDAGHGGYDNGACFEGRLEKDDNLRLALAVRDELEKLGQKVVMTRDSDVFVSLEDRAAIANNANSDYFVSLHRNSYDYETPWTRGVDAWIYTEAPQTYEGYARTILDQIVAVGVQADNGVRRANFSVLRNTKMPATLLEMGYIINAEDNRLFDENLNAYARAIAAGIVKAMNVTPETPETCDGDPVIRGIQERLNRDFGANIRVDGIYGIDTRRALVAAIQITLNNCCNANLRVDGVFGADTAERLWNLRFGSRGDLVWAVQSALYGLGYKPGNVDGIFGWRTTEAVRAFQRDSGLIPDGIVGRLTYFALFA